MGCSLGTNNIDDEEMDEKIEEPFLWPDRLRVDLVELAVVEVTDAESAKYSLESAMPVGPEMAILLTRLYLNSEPLFLYDKNDCADGEDIGCSYLEESFDCSEGAVDAGE